MSTFNTIGDFVWASNDTRDWQEEEMEQQERSLELMYMHQQYHGIIEKQQYTLRGSKLSCSYGTDYSLLDTVQDHGIYKGELPVLTTIDCGKSNICDFGSCLCPESNYAGRLPMTVGSKNGKTAKKASYNNFAHICIPMVPEGSVWQQVDHSIMAKTCAKGYLPLLLDSAALVCQYGGIIKIVEVSQAGTTQGSGLFDTNGMDIGSKALEIMENKYNKKEHIKDMVDNDGMCIFAMEGLGENSGTGISSLFPDGRYGAMLVVTKGNVVEFVTRHASTLPSALEITGNSKGIATVKEGVYYIAGKNHQGKYPAFGVHTEDTNDYYSLPCTRKEIGASGSQDDTADGINIHTAPNNTGELYSEGCQMIRSKDYIDFLFITDCISKNDEMALFLKGLSIDDSIMFKGENINPTGKQTLELDEDGAKYSKAKYGMKGLDGKDYWYIELLSKIKLKQEETPEGKITVATGYYVLDRTHMSKRQKNIFYIE